MTTDGSTGRRDGFNRWVASMKTEHQPLEAKPGALKPAVPKLELELDDNATHVHRIPKELIHRMREQQPQPQPIPREEPEDDDDESQVKGLGVIQEDRTAVFRPPPELLARAKRMKAPPKPDAQASVPTKPPPASQAELLQSMPAAPKVPGFESVPAAAKGGFSSVPAKSPRSSSVPARSPLSSSVPASTPAPVAAESAPVVAPETAALETPAAPLADFTEPLAETTAAAPASVSEPDSSAVFARQEPASGVLPVALAQAEPAPRAEEEDEPNTREYRMDALGVAAPARTVEPEPADALEEPTVLRAPVSPQVDSDSPFAFAPSSVVPILPPTVEVSGPVPVDSRAPVEEPGAPTTHAPVVRPESNAAPETRTPFAVRALVFVLAVAVAAAVAWWRTRHS
ncbi:MAG TPA: hypothetical protein VMI54_10425 [Polyangiaceae bacterium]|nr:hypothetical protein [Polyangiaceae bacterium]